MNAGPKQDEVTKRCSGKHTINVLRVNINNCKGTRRDILVVSTNISDEHFTFVKLYCIYKSFTLSTRILVVPFKRFFIIQIMPSERFQKYEWDTLNFFYKYICRNHKCRPESF